MRKTLLLIAWVLVPGLASATPANNGIFVNTSTMNGIFVNGRELSNGYVTAGVFGDETINGVRPFEAYKPGHYLYYPHVDGTGLAGWAWEWAVGGWVWRTGAWFEGTVLPAGVYDKTTGKTEIVTLRIAKVAAPSSAAMLLHTIEVRSTDQANVESWVPLCGRDDNQQPIPAIVLRGEWSMLESSSVGGDQISDSPYRVTFACTTGALGKCAATCTDAQQCAAAGVPYALGYKRWAAPHLAFDSTGKLVWRDYALDHQACTRMVRADYCGDGRSWTATGTPIDVYDRTLINTKTTAGSALWMYEATWNENGAVRISCDRLTEGPVSCPIGGDAPWSTILKTSYACYSTDGMEDSVARVGNLRRKYIALPLPFPRL